MTTAFQCQLGALTVQLGQLCAMATQAMDDATWALLEPDRKRAENVIAGREETDAMSASVRESTFLLLSMRTPVAADLAAAIDAVRIAVSAECMADSAVKVARIGFRRSGQAAWGEAGEYLADVGTSAVALARCVNDALVCRDSHAANGIIYGDDTLAHLHRQLKTARVAEDREHAAVPANDVTLLDGCYQCFVEHVLRIARCVAGCTACRGENSLDTLVGNSFTAEPITMKPTRSAVPPAAAVPGKIARILKGFVVRS